jgi:hypothetical protein
MSTPTQALLPWIGTWLTGDLGPWTLYTTRRQRLVFFPRSPPLTPPTVRQQTQMSEFAAANNSWQLLPKSARNELNQLCKTLSLPMTGRNLWFRIRIRKDPKLLQTLRDQATQKRERNKWPRR